MGRMISQSEQSLGFSSDLAATRNPITGIFGSGQVLFFTTNTTFVVPAGVTSVRVRMWGAGGSPSSNGGFGGTFALKTVLNLTPGEPIAVTVGTTQNGAGASSFGNYCRTTGGESGTFGENIGDIINLGSAPIGGGGGGAGNLMGRAGSGGYTTGTTTSRFGYIGRSGRSGTGASGGDSNSAGEFGNHVSIDHIGTGGGGGAGGAYASAYGTDTYDIQFVRFPGGDGANGGGGGGGHELVYQTAGSQTQTAADGAGGNGGFPGGGAGWPNGVGAGGLVIVEY